MRAACLVLLIGCGFQSRATGDNSSDAAVAVDGSSGGSADAAPAAPDGTTSQNMLCSSIALGSPQFRASACAPLQPTAVVVSASASIDTVQGTSTQAGLTCAVVANGTGNAHVCAIAAPSIVIEANATLSARGANPLLLVAHAITIHGTVDVASHTTGAIGAGSLQGGCIPGALPFGAGGGRGGNFFDVGGLGGDDGVTPLTGGKGGGTFVTVALLGGCGGTRGGDGTAGGGSDGGNATGGPGGGVVWIASDTAPLIIDGNAVINASGASGAGGTTEHHGGAGGGAGGLIVLQAPTIQLDPTASIFANGGHGGGGAGANGSGTGFTGGASGSDPTGPGGPTAGGTDGTGGTDGDPTTNPPPNAGDGAPGFPGTPRTGSAGGTPGRAGGGGGGAPGAIRVVSATNITGSNVSPPPLRLQ